ncbi:hypothetical protein D6827_02300 [Candidatus Parcubacteria bacterium]|nr:MAG: hypothetical protein D6827_02300 [Candidatus Parcubacteria bacterium]
MVPFVINLLAFISLNADTARFVEVLTSGIQIALFFWLKAVIIILTAVEHDKKPINTRLLGTVSWYLALPLLLASFAYFILVTIGMLAIIPGILFLIWFCFAPTIIVLKNTTLSNAFRDSRKITRGKELPLIWRIVVGVAVFTTIFMIVLVLMGFLISALQGITLQMLLTSPPSLAESTLEYLLIIAFAPIPIIYNTLLYLDFNKTAAKQIKIDKSDSK